MADTHLGGIASDKLFVTTSTSTPTVSNDSSAGYLTGISIWIQTTTNTVWILEDDSVGAANWIIINQGDIPQELSRSFFLENPAAASDFPVIRFENAVTLTKTVYAITGGTNWVGQLEEASDAQGTGAADTQASDSTVTGTTTVTSYSNAGIAAGNYVRLKTTSVSGSVTWLHVTFYYTED